MAAVTVQPDATGKARRSLVQHVMARQRRIHFKSESDRRRRELLAMMCALPVTTRIYVAADLDQRTARRLCLAQIVLDTQALAVPSALFVERVDGLVEQDSATIRAVRVSQPRLDWHHLAPTDDPLLWAADGFAWAAGAGPEWTSKIRGATEVTHLT